MARPLSLDDRITDPSNPERVLTKGEAIVNALRLGVPREHASRAAGVPTGTFYKWLAAGAEAEQLMEEASDPETATVFLPTPNQERLAEFRDEVEKADAEAVVYAVAMVRKAMPDSWQAAMTFLERRYPGQFARRLEVKTDPVDREPARFDTELAAAASETWRGLGLPEGFEAEDVLPALEAGE